MSGIHVWHEYFVVLFWRVDILPGLLFIGHKSLLQCGCYGNFGILVDGHSLCLS